MDSLRQSSPSPDNPKGVPTMNTVSQWFDERLNLPTIAEKAERLESFVTTMADGRVDDAELAAQEARVVALMKLVEPQLNAALHAQVTELLCELTAYDLMRTLHAMQKTRPTTQFRG